MAPEQYCRICRSTWTAMGPKCLVIFYDILVHSWTRILIYLNPLPRPVVEVAANSMMAAVRRCSCIMSRLLHWKLPKWSMPFYAVSVGQSCLSGWEFTPFDFLVEMFKLDTWSMFSMFSRFSCGTVSLSGTLAHSERHNLLPKTTRLSHLRYRISIDSMISHQ